MRFIPIHTDIVSGPCDISGVLIESLQKNGAQLQEGDIIAIASKVVSVSQGRTVLLKKLNGKKSTRRTRYGKGAEDSAFVELVLREADKVFPGPMLLTLKDGILIPSAGIDRSNAPEGYVILWPRNVWSVASNIVKTVRRTFALKNFGAVICDSRCQPLRYGTTGVALSWAGFEGVEDSRGEKDIFGKPLKVTRKAVADNLASAAEVLMGESAECIPFVIIRGAPVKFSRRIQKKSEIFVNPKDCLFRGIYNRNL